MAGSPLQINDVVRGVVAANTAQTQTVTLPTGTKRVLVVPFASVFNATEGPLSGEADQVTASYGGVSMTVTAVEQTEQLTMGVATLALEDQSFASETLSLNMNIDNSVYLLSQAFIFDGLRQGDGDLSYDSQIAEAVAASITLDAVTPEATGDLVFSFALSKDLSAGLEEYEGTDAEKYTLQDTLDSGDFTTPNVSDNSKGRMAYSFSVTGEQAATWSQTNSTTIAAVAFVIRQEPTKINCDCSASPQTETLLDLRKRMMIRLGFAAQVDNPPPGMASLLDDFLRAAQRQMYNKYESLRTERFFRWTMVPGERFYGIASDDVLACSGKTLEPKKITWVGYYDLNETWRPLTEGINPLRYTSLANNTGFPDSYEVRQCIEIFPAPQAAYTLVVKGRFGLLPFTDDAHVTTIDDELVFLLALANAKAHYQQADAGNYFSQATSYLGDLNSGNHGTARYVPGPKVAPSEAQPIFLPTQEG